jgi:O-acetyl-ADP-ribose deacetylase (regulator of RNase III)
LPAFYKDFNYFCKTESPKEGDVWAWMGRGTPVIFSLFTQSKASRKGGHPPKATKENLSYALKNLFNELDLLNIPSIAVNRISTAVGELDWNEVKGMIEQDLSQFEGQVFLYSNYKPKMMASEQDTCCGVCP